MRPLGRKPDQLHAVSFERNYIKHAEDSCLVRFGDTHVLCTASLEERVPPCSKSYMFMILQTQREKTMIKIKFNEIKKGKPNLTLVLFESGAIPLIELGPLPGNIMRPESLL